MKYDDTIIRCIRRACDHYGKGEFAKLVGFDPGMISKIFSGRSPGCKDSTWKRMFPLLVEHGGLDPDTPQYWSRSQLGILVCNSSVRKITFNKDTPEEVSIVSLVTEGRQLSDEYLQAIESQINDMEPEEKLLFFRLYDRYKSLSLPSQKVIVKMLKALEEQEKQIGEMPDDELQREIRAKYSPPAATPPPSGAK